MKRLLYVSIFLNFIALLAAFFTMERLGGWNHVLIRLQRQTEALYFHRAQHFEQLPARPGCIIFLGDSQTEKAEWNELFPDGPPVLNRGISGDFSEAMLKRLPEILRHKPLKIFLLVGVNDLIFGNKIANIEAVYRAMVQKIRTDSPDSELYLESILPVNNTIRRSGVNNERIQALNERILQIAHDFALPYLDIAQVLKDADGNLATTFTEDGLHLNGLGYLVWKKEIESFMRVK